MCKAITQTVERTLRYLQKKQGADGLWKDYQLVTGESSSWVTAYTGCALAQCEKSAAIHDEGLARQITAMIQRAKIGLLDDETAVAGAWGFNPKLFPDADSTAITIRFLLAAGVPIEHPAMTKGLHTIARAQQENGGCATYHEDDLNGEQFAGWTQPHLSVTMTCIMAWTAAQKHSTDQIQFSLPIKKAISYLTEQFPEPGFLWEDYWWVGPYYPTYLVVTVLESLHILDDQARTEISTAILTYQQEDGGFAALNEQSDCFATALSLSTLLLLDPNLLKESEPAARALAWLLHQEEDGQFPPGAYMRMPTPTFRHREDEENQRITTDVNGIFTTATVLHVLLQVPVPTERME